MVGRLTRPGPKLIWLLPKQMPAKCLLSPWFALRRRIALFCFLTLGFAQHFGNRELSRLASL